jgi:hypothetical protein
MGLHGVTAGVGGGMQGEAADNAAAAYLASPFCCIIAVGVLGGILLICRSKQRWQQQEFLQSTVVICLYMLRNHADTCVPTLYCTWCCCCCYQVSIIPTRNSSALLPGFACNWLEYRGYVDSGETCNAAAGVSLTQMG